MSGCSCRLCQATQAISFEAGVTLFEMQPFAGQKATERSRARWAAPVRLHAKTFCGGSVRFFVGSFNFDPRSAQLNTELGFVIDSPVLAQKIEAAFNSSIPANS